MGGVFACAPNNLNSKSVSSQGSSSNLSPRLFYISRQRGCFQRLFGNRRSKSLGGCLFKPRNGQAQQSRSPLYFTRSRFVGRGHRWRHRAALSCNILLSNRSAPPPPLASPKHTRTIAAHIFAQNQNLSLALIQCFELEHENREQAKREKEPLLVVSPPSGTKCPLHG